ncbi:MAG TPA: hypothetical protein VLE19_10075, partial [Pyrinomonadaceae bacterium]|nr:hypothetical protein [Pyrinomonadaceae bacterium]
QQTITSRKSGQGAGSAGVLAGRVELSIAGENIKSRNPEVSSTMKRGAHGQAGTPVLPAPAGEDT